MPDWAPSPTTCSWWMIGRIVREMRFQSSVRWMGMTGWTFIVNRHPCSSTPMSTSQFAWIGTLIRLATGFWSCFASSSSFAARSGIASRRRQRIQTRITTTRASCRTAGRAAART